MLTQQRTSTTATSPCIRKSGAEYVMPKNDGSPVRADSTFNSRVVEPRIAAEVRRDELAQQAAVGRDDSTSAAACDTPGLKRPIGTPTVRAFSGELRSSRPSRTLRNSIGRYSLGSTPGARPWNDGGVTPTT